MPARQDEFCDIISIINLACFRVREYQNIDLSVGDFASRFLSLSLFIRVLLIND